MSKNTGNNIIIGGAVLLAVWYFWKQSNPANAANVLSNPSGLSDSLDQSAATAVNSLFNSSGVSAS